MPGNIKNILQFSGIFHLALLSFLFFSCLVIISCSEEVQPPPSYQYSIPVTDNDGWETDSIQAAGLDLAPLQDMMNYLNSIDNDNMHSILIIRNGKLVFEEYFQGWTFNSSNPDNCKGNFITFNRFTTDNVASVTKSFTAALIGIAIDHGFIENENAKLFSYFPDYSILKDDERKDKIELQHLLSNTSGLDWPEWDYDVRDPLNPLTNMWAASDPIAYILSRPMKYEPGSVFNYNGGNTVLLGEIVRKVSGLRADEFSQIYLFGPMGISSFQWWFFPNGVVYASGELTLRPRDMAKLGQLYLDGGVWKGIRILSEEFVNKSLSEYISPIPHFPATSYGYTWWIKSFQIEGNTVLTQSARGWGGQYIFLIPEKDMVVVLTAGNYSTFDFAMDIFEKYILPAAY